MIRPLLGRRGYEVNVLKPHLQSTVFTLIQKGLSQREIHRKTGIDRKTIRGYANMMVAVAVAAESNSSTLATGSGELPDFQIPPPRPTAICAEISLRAMPKLARSACEPHREWIEAQVRLGRNAVAIDQELVDQRGCRFHRCRPYAPGSRVSSRRKKRRAS